MKNSEFWTGSNETKQKKRKRKNLNETENLDAGGIQRVKECCKNSQIKSVQASSVVMGLRIPHHSLPPS